MVCSNKDGYENSEKNYMLLYIGVLDKKTFRAIHHFHALVFL